MPEPTIICPKCKAEIPLTESLTAPLLEVTRKQYERRLSQKDKEIEQREEVLRDKEKKIAEVRRRLDQQVAKQVYEKLKAERVQIIEEEGKKAKLASALQMEAKIRELDGLKEVLAEKNEELAEAQRAQAEALKKQRQLDDAKRSLDLTVERRVHENLSGIRAQAKREAEEAERLKVAERDQKIASMQRTIEELRRKAEQGSQQLQGEVQELELEDLLRARFPDDTIQPVPKGALGRGGQVDLLGYLLRGQVRGVGICDAVGRGEGHGFIDFALLCFGTFKVAIEGRIGLSLGTRHKGKHLRLLRVLPHGLDDSLIGAAP
jgi:hypothetical protein